MDFDFLTEYKKLQLQAPRLSMVQLNAINSEYVYNADQVRNCYLIANAVKDENCMYGRDFYSNADCVDCDHLLQCTLCYQCLNCQDCYNSDFLQDCANSSDCRYGYYLKGCRDCTGCVGLKQKRFCLFNEQLTEAEYRARVAGLGRDEIVMRFEALKREVPRVHLLHVDSENCTGNNVYHSRNAHESYDVGECQDSGYLLETKDLRDCWDITVLEHGELNYQISSCYIMNNCNFCFFCVDSSNVEYGECLFNCQDCFGCIALHRKQYYILNQPYEKEAYFKRVAEIKDQLRAQGLYGQMILPPTFPREDTVAVWDRM